MLCSSFVSLANLDMFMLLFAYEYSPCLLQGWYEVDNVGFMHVEGDSQTEDENDITV